MINNRKNYDKNDPATIFSTLNTMVQLQWRNQTGNTSGGNKKLGHKLAL